MISGVWRRKPDVKYVKSDVLNQKWRLFLIMENKPAEPAEKPGKKNKKGLYIIGAAVAILIAGYFVLSKVNADASNWAGVVSPILIISGYIGIGAGILVGWDE